ncbi:PRD domain-containing protein, partial [Coprobacillus cateniformis]|nr:PRD domain-containing protein [Coprobacillus cateniformis]
KMYPQSYHCVQKMKQYVYKVFQCELSQDEEAYLILHIHRVTYRDK